eukprot:TRINITY_DN7274_c0_g1_i1.p1 TRINITY_DN7274_c0_g1~~TRINITY_DN7274_c0_g1_i1.p1  ORF type:complete len:546 (+),score=133.02 TRINITY_DN7274_c0_g1_i1:65-1639(+)
MLTLLSQLELGCTATTLWLSVVVAGFVVVVSRAFLSKAEASPSSAPTSRTRRSSISTPSTSSLNGGEGESEGPVNTNATGEGEALWGRYYGGDLFWSFVVTMVFVFTPMMVFYFYIACNSYDCALSTPALQLYETGDFAGIIWDKMPVPTLKALQILSIWVGYQVVLYLYLPGPQAYGQETPAGNKLLYNVNGLRAFILSNLLYVGLSDPRFGVELFSPTIVYDNWGSMLCIANILGYAVATFCYFKAMYAPTHPGDVKFSGSTIYDYFMGAEMNPRIGELDFKLFFNGRPGIIAWNIINISFMYAQVEATGQYPTNSILLVGALHFLYIIDFFINEDWYLKTIDINQDHMGWYLGWGDCVWLPYMYTLQGFYLVTHPVDLTPMQFGLVAACGMVGYAIFRGTNAQKDSFRNSGGQEPIWGKLPTYVVASYKTADGATHKSLLLTSGFWGLARHFNYLGDLLISFAYCAACGFDHLLPYFYIVFMAILLVHRVGRDHHRCHAKYGDKWDEYCAAVPYRIIPYVW